jgi:D-alanyl-D-alanine carboxypeptidase
VITGTSTRVLLVSLVVMTAASISCTVEEMERPSSIIAYDGDFSHHPKDSLYQSVLDKYVARGLSGLSVAVITPAESLWLGAAGYANIEDGVKMNPNHVQYASSLTKSYTATLIMLLSEADSIDLDAAIDQYLPDSICDRVPNGHKATLRNLLSHTSGIPDYDMPYMIDVLNDYNYTLTPQDFLEYVYKMKPLWEPGEGFSYSNINFLLLALMVDSLALDHADYLQERVLDPLNLGKTYYRNHPDYPQPAGLVNSYSAIFGNERIFNLSDVQNIMNSAYVGEDGLMATPFDIAMFYQALLRGQIVNSESLEEMTTWIDEAYPGITTTDPYGLYGHGLVFRDTPHGYSVGHYGSLIGDNADAFYFPEHDVTVVFTTNCSGPQLDEIYREELIPELFDAIFKK